MPARSISKSWPPVSASTDRYFRPSIMGGVLGAATMASSLGMSFGPLAGGWAFDAFGNYTWLYLGSSAAGLAAVAIALGFPKPTGPLQTQPVPA